MVWLPTDASGKCVRYNSAGFRYEEFVCLYPRLAPIYFPLEKEYDPAPVRDWMARHSPWFPLIACALYGLMIVLGRAYFSKRAPWNWRKTMAFWNLLLSVFSAIGFVRVLPHFIHILWNYSLRDNLCNDPENHFGSGTTGLWVQLFILSKFPELLDTWFIVIHKKPLIFLHWYHHVSVLLYCWHSYVTKAPAGLTFCVMNYGVHAVMYFYYFLMAVSRKKIKWAMLITSLQISQMVVGVIVTLMGFYISSTTTSDCWLSRENNWAAFIMYGSYLVLFLEFFIARYFGRKQSKSKTDSSVGKKQGTNGTKSYGNGASHLGNGKSD